MPMLFAEAAAYFKRSLFIKSRALGRSHADVIHALVNLGKLHDMNDRQAEASSIYGRALHALETQPSMAAPASWRESIEPDLLHRRAKGREGRDGGE